MQALMAYFLGVTGSIVRNIDTICTKIVHYLKRTSMKTKKDGYKSRLFNDLSELAAVIHTEFDWMRCHTHLSHFFHLKINIAIDPVIGKYTATR